MLYDRFVEVTAAREWDSYRSDKTVARYVKHVMAQRGNANAGGGYLLANERTGTVYTYNADGNITSIANVDGNDMEFEYSGENLRRVSNKAGWMIFTSDSDGNTTSVSDSTGRSITLSYADGGLVSVENPDGDGIRYAYNDDHCVTEITNFNGVVYLYNEYDTTAA